MLKIQLEVVLALPKDVDIVRNAGVVRASNRKRSLEVEQLQGLCSRTFVDEFANSSRHFLGPIDLPFIPHSPQESLDEN